MADTKQFSGWRHQRPFAGAVLLVIAGIEMFFSTQLDIGKLHVQLGIEGFQATVIPVGFVLLGVLIALMPQHRIFYGVIALALSVYSIVGVNLGGFIVGFLLSAIGGILAVSWAPAAAPATAPASMDTASAVGAEEDAAPTVDRERSHDEAVHAEFAPYSQLMAIANSHVHV
jgi:hypothetical protein